MDLVDALGGALRRHTVFCLAGCAPGILYGQPGRTTHVIEIWEPMSSFDRNDLARGCERTGVRCDVGDDLDPEAINLRILRPGMAAYPEQFEAHEIERYGRLTITMPPTPALVAATLTSVTNTTDVDDFVFWMGEHRLKLAAIEEAIDQLAPEQREKARENLLLARLVAIDGLAT